MKKSRQSFIKTAGIIGGALIAAKALSNSNSQTAKSLADTAQDNGTELTPEAIKQLIQSDSSLRNLLAGRDGKDGALGNYSVKEWTPYETQEAGKLYFSANRYLFLCHTERAAQPMHTQGGLQTPLIHPLGDPEHFYLIKDFQQEKPSILVIEDVKQAITFGQLYLFNERYILLGMQNRQALGVNIMPMYPLQDDAYKLLFDLQSFSTSKSIFTTPINGGTNPLIQTIDVENPIIVLNDNCRLLLDINSVPTYESHIFELTNNVKNVTFLLPRSFKDIPLASFYFPLLKRKEDGIFFDFIYEMRPNKEEAWFNHIQSLFVKVYDDGGTPVAELFYNTIEYPLFVGSIPTNYVNPENPNSFYTGSSKSLNIGAAKANFKKDTVYRVINGLNTGGVLTLNFGEVLGGYTTAQTILLKRGDASIGIAPEQTEFKNSVGFLLSSYDDKFHIVN